jgi:hypothetical protein
VKDFDEVDVHPVLIIVPVVRLDVTDVVVEFQVVDVKAELATGLVVSVSVAKVETISVVPEVVEVVTVE